MFEKLELIIKSNKQKRKGKDYLGILLNSEAVLEYLPALIQYEVDKESEYRKFEASILELEGAELKGRKITSSLAETLAKATNDYKEFRKAQLFRELSYEVVQMGKKIAGSVNQEFNAH